MSIPVIIMCGRAHSGKDTAADYLVAKYGATKLALADQLKVITQKLVELFYGTVIPLEEFYNTESKEKVRPTMPDFGGGPFTLRSVLQLVGSEVFRDMIGRDIWCNILRQKISGLTVISDCRFPNEAEYFRSIPEFSVTCIRLTRDACMKNNDHTSHQSEVYVDEISVDYEIENNSTIGQLHTHLNQIIKKMNNIN